MKSSPHTEEITEYTEEEMKKAIERIKDTKPMEWLEFKVKLWNWDRGSGGGGGTNCPELPNKHFQYILKPKQIPDSWHEGKLVILFRKGDPKDTINYRPLSLLSHSYKICIRLWMKTSQESKQDSEKVIRLSASSKPNSSTFYFKVKIKSFSIYIHTCKH